MCCRFALVGTYAGWFYLRFIKVAGVEGTQAPLPAPASCHIRFMVLL